MRWRSAFEPGFGSPSGKIFAARRLRVPEMAEKHLGVGILEIVARIFLLGLEEDIAVGDLPVAVEAVEVEIVDRLDALQVHGEAFEPVGEFARDRRAFEACDLLEVGELADLHAVAPAFPPQPPGAERRALPIVLDEADVVTRRVDPDGRRASGCRGPADPEGSASG